MNLLVNLRYVRPLVIIEMNVVNAVAVKSILPCVISATAMVGTAKP